MIGGDKNDKSKIEKEIQALETEMAGPDFWSDKRRAQESVRRHQELKEALSGVGKYDKGDAIMTLLSGAGGDDAEDFSRILYEMYLKFFGRNGFESKIIHKNENDHGGYRNITVEISGNPSAGSTNSPQARSGQGPYGILKNESGVHRLVRISPFSSKNLRHTSFSLVEVIPKFEKGKEEDIPEKELRVEFSRSSGPGGQNVNKRETSVRVVHIPTNLSAGSESERSQAQNKDKAIEILKGKLYKLREEERKKKEEGMYVSKTMEVEWGNQIRSYVFHPYKMIKDHRTGVEARDIKKIIEDGELDEFIEAERAL